MARRIHLRSDISVDELERRYRAAKEPHERSWWQILWLLTRGQKAKDIAESTGLFGVLDRADRQTLQRRRRRRDAQSAVHPFAPRPAPLIVRAAGRAGRGGAWSGPGGRRVAGAHRGGVDEPEARSPSARATRLGLPRAPQGKRRKPRPRHVQADPAEQEAFKKRSTRSSTRSRAPSPTRRSSSGPPTNTASG